MSRIDSQVDTPVVVIKADGVRYKMVLPNASEDHIQGQLLQTREPYELEMLKSMCRKLSRDDLVLDIGANIGNHTLYLASVAQAQVIAFEPNAHLCAALNESVVMNQLHDLVAVRQIGLGSTTSFARFQESIPENLGAQALTIGDGDIQVIPLDSIQLDKTVRAMKIDVEGMELAVLQGARRYIERDRPILYVECREEKGFRKIFNWAQSNEYTCWESFNVTPTYLLLPSETISLDQRIDHLHTQYVVHERRLASQLKKSRRNQLSYANEVAHLTSQLTSEQATSAAARTQVEALRKELIAQAETLAGSEERCKLAISELKTTNALNLERNRVRDRELREYKVEMTKVRAYGRELEDRYEAILNSSSWKSLEPVRMLLRLAKRRKKPGPFVPRFRTGGDLAANEWARTLSKAPDISVNDLVRKLWGGFSNLAVVDLNKAVKNTRVKTADRVKAAWNLARWAAAAGEWKLCLSHLGTIAYLDKKVFRAKRTRILVIEANLRVGNPAKAIEYAQHGLSREQDGNFVCAISNSLLQTEDSKRVDKQRLAVLNQLYCAYDLQQLRFLDSEKGFAFGNLIGQDNRCIFATGPKISILVPVYNARMFLEIAIRSLLEQSWRNIEIIAVDDASTDGSWSILQQLCKEDERLRAFRNDKNLGAYPTRNRALEEATGELVTVHDSDDWSHPQMLEIQARSLVNSSDIRATFTAMARVLPNLEFVLRPERDFLEYVHRSYPSLMMRRSDLAVFQQWDNVAANADDELVQRIRTVWGESAIRNVLPLTPMSFFLRHANSLTEHRDTHLRSLTFGVRYEYSKQAAFWRKSMHPEQIVDGRSIVRTSYKHPFPIPIKLAPKHWRRNLLYDLVIFSDLGLLGGTRRCNEGYISAATALGYRVGLFHWPRYDLELSEIADEYRRLSYQENVDILVPEDSIECNSLIIHHPPILTHRIDAIPKIKTKRVGILVNQLPMQRRSSAPHYYFPDDVTTTCRELFKKDPQWLPISAITRRMLNEIGGYATINETDWSPPLGRALVAHNAPKRRSVGGAQQIVIGRHSRDHATKWPNTATKIRAAYCADTDITVHLMGGVRTPKLLLENLPNNWRTFAFDEKPVSDFLSELDFFVHFIDDDYIEEFGRNIMEAMAEGVLVVLPPVFRETFGDAAVYSEPENVLNTVRQLWAKPDIYHSQTLKGYYYVRENCDEPAVMRRLESFVKFSIQE